MHLVGSLLHVSIVMLVHKHKRHREYKWQLPLVVDSTIDMYGKKKTVIHTHYSRSVP